MSTITRRCLATVSKRKDINWATLGFDYYPTACHLEFTHRDGKVRDDTPIT
jgi:hypothetical protein